MQHDHYEIFCDKSLLDIDSIHGYLANESYWATGISREDVVRCIENSLCFGMYESTGRMVGFARVVTDYTRFAYLMDVFIRDEFRSKGLGKQLMEYILNLDELKRVSWLLATKDARGFYEKLGFAAGLDSNKYLSLRRKPQI